MVLDPIHPIDPRKRSEVLDALGRIEQEHCVRVVFACESGSRGWGFSSPDSDYDGRFIYVHPAEWYLSVSERTGLGQPQRDVIELPVADDLDVSGWDLRKALRLLLKSNPTLLEWLRSPILYRQDQMLVDELRLLAERYYSPIAAWHHYLSMAKGNFRGYLRGDRVRRKKYLYVLRPMLACMWIERFDTPPPMAFEDLLEQLLPSGPVRQAVDRLLATKRRSAEVADGPVIPEISGFLGEALEQRLDSPPRLRAVPGDAEALDAFLRKVLRNEAVR